MSSYNLPGATSFSANSDGVQPPSQAYSGQPSQSGYHTSYPPHNVYFGDALVPDSHGATRSPVRTFHPPPELLDHGFRHALNISHSSGTTSSSSGSSDPNPFIHHTSHASGTTSSSSGSSDPNPFIHHISHAAGTTPSSSGSSEHNPFLHHSPAGPMYPMFGSGHSGSLFTGDRRVPSPNPSVTTSPLAYPTNSHPYVHYDSDCRSAYSTSPIDRPVSPSCKALSL